MRNPKEEDNKWFECGLRIFMNTVSHPFDYAKVLIQIGYEPIAPRPARTLFGRPALKLPNIFQYVKHIRSIDGVAGCYRGLGPKLCGNIISTITTQKMIEYLDLKMEESDEDSEETRQERFIKYLKGDLITHATAIIISHPFHVITVRIMSQFVGKEKHYVGIFGSTVQIYKQNGLLGFFHGLVPRLIGDLLSVAMASTLVYFVNKVVEDKQIQKFCAAASSMLSSSVMYPFQVVSNCMAVTNSGLVAGFPPNMPLYTSWVNCWVDLSARNQLKRGSSVLIRYYVPPTYLKANVQKAM